MIRKEAPFVEIREEKGLGKVWPKGYKSYSLVCRECGLIEFYLDEKGLENFRKKNPENS